MQGFLSITILRVQPPRAPTLIKIMTYNGCGKESTYVVVNCMSLNYQVKEITMLKYVLEKRLGIPEDKVNYLVYPAKITADIMMPCKCNGNCCTKLFEMEDMIPKVQGFRLLFWSLPQGPMRQNKLMELIRSSRVLMLNTKIYQHSFEGVLFCM